MPELPPDLPRLWTLRKYLLLQLAAVDRAIEQAENGRPETPEPTAGWWIQWRRSPPGTVLVGVLHTAGCMLTKGRPLTAQQVQAERHREGHRLTRCEVCVPELP